MQQKHRGYSYLHEDSKNRLANLTEKKICYISMGILSQAEDRLAAAEVVLKA